MGCGGMGLEGAGGPARTHVRQTSKIDFGLFSLVSFAKSAAHTLDLSPLCVMGLGFYIPGSVGHWLRK